MSTLRRLVVSLALVLVMAPAGAAVFQPRDFASPEAEERYKQLILELRCLVCQNQSLADSNADLAVDLRREVYAMISDGASDEEITDFMVQRYGDFVLYRPPVKATTALLWVGPFVLGAAAVAFLLFQVRRRRRDTASPALSESERSRVSEILDDLQKKDT